MHRCGLTCLTLLLNSFCIHLCEPLSLFFYQVCLQPPSNMQADAASLRKLQWLVGRLRFQGWSLLSVQEEHARLLHDVRKFFSSLNSWQNWLHRPTVSISHLIVLGMNNVQKRKEIMFCRCCLSSSPPPSHHLIRTPQCWWRCVCALFSTFVLNGFLNVTFHIIIATKLRSARMLCWVD